VWREWTIGSDFCVAGNPFAPPGEPAEKFSSGTLCKEMPIFGPSSPDRYFRTREISYGGKDREQTAQR